MAYKKNHIPWNRNKHYTYEEMYGKEKAESLKKNSSSRVKNKSYEEMYGPIKAKQKIDKYILTRKGKPVMEETKIKIRNSLLGSKLLPESIIKRTNTRKKYYSEGKWIHHFKGKHLSEEHRKKISNSSIGRKVEEETKQKMRENKLKRLDHGISNQCRKKQIEQRKYQVMPFKDSSIEIKIQNFLTQLGIEFYPHQYIKEIEHAYQCDVFIPSMNLIIECDGDYWHGNPLKYISLSREQYEQQLEDITRTKELEEAGYKVLRLWETDINKMNLNDFKEVLKYD